MNSESLLTAENNLWMNCCNEEIIRDTHRCRQTCTVVWDCPRPAAVCPQDRSDDEPASCWCRRCSRRVHRAPAGGAPTHLDTHSTGDPHSHSPQTSPDHTPSYKNINNIHAKSEENSLVQTCYHERSFVLFSFLIINSDKNIPTWQVHFIQLFFSPSFFCWFPLVLHTQVTFLLISLLYCYFPSSFSLFPCCSIKVRVSSPLKPSPTFGSASPWRGIPDNEGSGHR